MDELRWRYYELKRLYRLMRPEASAALLIKTVGAFWLWRHGARREYRIYPWKDRRYWYAVDIALPHKSLGIEADGAVHKKRKKEDIVRDHRLGEKGWQIMRVTTDEMIKHPRDVKREVRAFLKG